MTAAAGGGAGGGEDRGGGPAGHGAAARGHPAPGRHHQARHRQQGPWQGTLTAVSSYLNPWFTSLDRGPFLRRPG